MIHRRSAWKTLASLTLLAEELGLELYKRGLEEFVHAKDNCVTLSLPKSKLEFVVWIFEEHDAVEGACFPQDEDGDHRPAKITMESFPATSGVALLRDMVRYILEEEMGFFSECSRAGRVGGLSEEKQIEIGLIDPGHIVELDEVLAALS